MAGEERDTRPPPPGRRIRPRAATAAAGAPRRLAPRTRGRACALTARARASASFCRARTRTWKTRGAYGARADTRATPTTRRRSRAGRAPQEPGRGPGGPTAASTRRRGAPRRAPSRRLGRKAAQACPSRRASRRVVDARARLPGTGTPGSLAARQAGARGHAPPPAFGASSVPATKKSAASEGPHAAAPAAKSPRRLSPRAPARAAEVVAMDAGGALLAGVSPVEQRSSPGREVFFSRVAPSAGVSVRGDSAGERRSERRSAGDEARDARVVAAQRGRVDARRAPVHDGCSATRRFSFSFF